MTATADLRHPVALLVDALVAALQDDAAPTKAITPRVYILPDDTILPEEALPPFYGVIVRDGRVSIESSDDQEWTWPIEIGAYQVLEAPTLAARVTGLAPFAPAARVGLLDLVWAANRTIRGRGLGAKYGRFRLVGESATGVVISGDGNEASVLVRRALKFEFDVGVSFTPLT